MIGVHKACELAGLDVGEVAAIGDSENDDKMLTGCGWGVAVGNAPDDTREAASYAARLESGDGVVEALEWLRVF